MTLEIIDLFFSDIIFKELEAWIRSVKKQVQFEYLISWLLSRRWEN